MDGGRVWLKMHAPGRYRFLALLVIAVFGLASWSLEARTERPNILFVTVDDMSCDSIGAFGCKVPQTSPNIDRFAGEASRFQHAHVQTGSCMPSRNVMFSGRYSHQNKIEGFYQVREINYPVIVDLMREGGYFTGIRGKVSHSTPYHPYGWDLVLEDSARNNKNVPSYGRSTREGIEAARKAGKPFFLNINISDPHKPFYAEGRGGVTVEDPNVPSRVFTPEEIVVPGFLPDDPVVRKELAHYYSSVRRADDCFGEIMKELKASGEASNTVVIFLSDHGMPLPFAKTQVYHHSTRTPWIVRWPKITEPGAVDTSHMISAIDFLPTVLDIADIRNPKGLQGRSVVPLLKGKKERNRQMVFKHHNENSGGHRNPMRAVETKEYLYIFNPWVNGSRTMASATTGTSTYRRMKELARKDPSIAVRVELLDHRHLEELYHVKQDPDCLKNLINDPASAKQAHALRNTLAEWMKETSDPLLPIFKQRTDPAIREAYILKLEEESTARGGRKARRKNDGE